MKNDRKLIWLSVLLFSLTVLPDDRPVAAQTAGGVAYRNTVTGVRDEVDRKDPVERFLLLTPGGPTVIEITILIDGQPFRIAREELIDKSMATADADNDGTVTWDEALSNPRFGFGRIRATSDQQTAAYMKLYDGNQNGTVERTELRALLARLFQGPAFTLTGFGSRPGQAAAYGGVSGATVLSILDTDTNGELSADEIAAASQRLKSRDADDNDLLYSNELVTAVNSPQRRPTNAGAYQRSASVVLLGPAANSTTVFATLRSAYAPGKKFIPADAFRAMPELFSQLDANDDDKLEASETFALNEAEPHIVLSLKFGKSEEAGLKLQGEPHDYAKLTVENAAKNDAVKNDAVKLQRPGVSLELTANLSPPRVADYTSTARRLVQTYDKDGNGYLESDELQAGLRAQFDFWDLDGDGKVFEKEIKESYAQRTAPLATQVRALATTQANPLFTQLDGTGDGRLSLREMRTAAAGLLKLDKNGDGKLAAEEVPYVMSVTFSRGNTSYYRVQSNGQLVRPAAGPLPDGPVWFTRMDRNGDGDVTMKEFLGDESAFRKLDANRDGFIESAEATAGSK